MVTPRRTDAEFVRCMNRRKCLRLQKMSAIAGDACGQSHVAGEDDKYELGSPGGRDRGAAD